MNSIIKSQVRNQPTPTQPMFENLKKHARCIGYLQTSSTEVVDSPTLVRMEITWNSGVPGGYSGKVQVQRGVR